MYIACAWHVDEINYRQPIEVEQVNVIFFKCSQVAICEIQQTLILSQQKSDIHFEVDQ